MLYSRLNEQFLAFHEKLIGPVPETTQIARLWSLAPATNVLAREVLLKRKA
jgi:hypothetical protein